MTTTFLDVRVDDVVRLRKAHACGGLEWRIVRTGADIGAVCLKCGRRLLFPRDQFRRAIKVFIQKAPRPDGEGHDGQISA